MLPDEVYKRRQRHNNTPESILLIIANFIVVSVDITLFANKKHVHWFFWVIIGVLALYNFFVIRKNREEFNKFIIISYVVSIFVLIAFFFFFRGKA
jgi:hypothetical protein